MNPVEENVGAHRRAQASANRENDPEKGVPEDSSREQSLVYDAETGAARDQVQEDENAPKKRSVLKTTILIGLAALILAWWISSTILKATRHRWIVQTVWAWFFLGLIFFEFVPSSIVWRPITATWRTVVAEPFFRLPYAVRLTLGWLCLLGIVFGSAFGFPLPEGTAYGDRAISVLGLLVFQFSFWATSMHRTRVPWSTVIVGLFMQQVLALFVLKTDAGLKIFSWIAIAAGDLLAEAYPAAQFFFDVDTINKHWFFINVLAAVICFIALVQMFYYLGVMQFIIKKFAVFFFATLNVSGAEAVVASASPFVGQGESACLIRPFVDLCTDSEIHLIMTSGFSTISGSVLSAYILLGVPAQNLITASMMSIPASIAISKLRVPEIDEPVTRGRVVIDPGDRNGRLGPPANALHAFSRGATFGLVVAGQILANLLTVLALVYTINGLLTYIGKGFGIHELTLQLILGYVFYPVTFFMGVPRHEIITVSRLLGTKLYASEFVAYTNLQKIQQGLMPGVAPLSQRAYTIVSYALCGFANLGSLGIQIGVLTALSPVRGKAIARLAPSAMICGFISTMQTAGLAGMLV